MLYVIAIPKFSPEAQDAIGRFRERHEPERARLVAPHITLVFGLRGYDPDAFVSFCRQTARPWKRFAVTFDDHETAFDPVEGTFKLTLACARGRDEIVALHQALYSGEHGGQRRSDLPFRPHMTVATNVRAEALSEIDMSELGPLPICGVVDAINVAELSAGRLADLARIALDG